MSFQMVVGITHFRSDQITHLSYIKIKKQTSILTNVISDINGRVFVLYIFYLCSKTLPQLLKHTISDRAVCILTTYPHTHDGWLGFRSLWSSDLCSFLSLPPPILCPYFPSSFRPGQDTEPGQEIPVVYSRHRSFHAFTECYILEELKHDPLS